MVVTNSQTTPDRRALKTGAVRAVLMLSLVIGLTGPLFAQRPTERDLPNVGSRLPDVTVYDAEGQRFSTRELRGHHTVLVFGCLT